MQDPFSEITADYVEPEDTVRLLADTPVGHAILLVMAGARLGLRTPLRDQLATIGRSPDSTFPLDIDSVSRHHARIEWDGKAHVVVDLDSTNGTYVNEVRVSRKALTDGDRVRIGKVLLKYVGGNNVELACHEELQRLMRYDGLTGVANRVQFAEAMGQELRHKDAAQRRLSLVIFDVDRFKGINDHLGHTGGDIVLQQIARAAAELVTAPQLLARIGGEEFAVVCPDLNLGQAKELAERIRAAVGAREIMFGGKRVMVTVSLGVAERDCAGAEAAESLFKRADAQLYLAKGAGRNCVR